MSIMLLLNTVNLVITDLDLFYFLFGLNEAVWDLLTFSEQHYACCCFLFHTVVSCSVGLRLTPTRWTMRHHGPHCALSGQELAKLRASLRFLRRYCFLPVSQDQIVKAHYFGTESDPLAV